MTASKNLSDQIATIERTLRKEQAKKYKHRVKVRKGGQGLWVMDLADNTGRQKTRQRVAQTFRLKGTHLHALATAKAEDQERRKNTKPFYYDSEPAAPGRTEVQKLITLPCEGPHRGPRSPGGGDSGIQIAERRVDGIRRQPPHHQAHSTTPTGVEPATPRTEARCAITRPATTRAACAPTRSARARGSRRRRAARRSRPGP